jgi:uncharacterized protein YceK
MKRFIFCLLMSVLLLSGCFSIVNRNYNVRIVATESSTVSFAATIVTAVDKESEIEQDTEIDATRPRWLF